MTHMTDRLKWLSVSDPTDAKFYVFPRASIFFYLADNIMWNYKYL